ncbi:MAG: hypothetical protein EB059_01975 [Alphaproteobacteria bacterium]|nr:hypothetical protein [Alphaproteobacteria bacterium]
MRIMCGAYLFYLGFRELRGSFLAGATLGENTEKRSYRDAFLMGFIANITNPKAIAYYISIFSAAKAFDMPLSYQLVAVVMMPLIAFGWHTVVALWFHMHQPERLLSSQDHGSSGYLDW